VSGVANRRSKATGDRHEETTGDDFREFKDAESRLSLRCGKGERRFLEYREHRFSQYRERREFWFEQLGEQPAAHNQASQTSKEGSQAAE